MTVIQMKRATSTRWAELNPVLALAEPGYDKTLHQMKVGDGVTPWNTLPWFGVTELAGLRGVITRDALLNALDLGNSTGDFRGLPGKDGEDGEDGDPGPPGPIVGLDGLLDVDATTPSNGDTIRYDSASQTWKKSGGTVTSAWEASRTVTFTRPSSETDLQSSTKAVSSTKPNTAQIGFTVTAGMLCTASDTGQSGVTALGFETALTLHGSVNENGGTNVSARLDIELVVNGGVRHTGTNTATRAANRRSSFSCGTGPVAVGDYVEVRLWYGTGTAVPGAALDWWAKTSAPTKLGLTADAQSRLGLFRNVSVIIGTTLNATTTFTQVPGYTYVSSGYNQYRPYDNGVAMLTGATALDIFGTYLANAANGILRQRGPDERLGGHASLSNGTTTTVTDSPGIQSITFERCWVPAA